ncbi:MAG: trigger factor [Lachnospiraceae bacterium]|nr:trigger factor [Lachnospiraceae bacterium]
MSFKVENLEAKNMVKLVIECSAEDFDKAIVKAYNKRKNQISIPGFRKGKAPLNMVEKMYGSGVFYEDAANELMPDAYEQAAKECGLEIVSQPEVDVVQVEKGKAFIFSATVATKPEVELGEYKGVKVEKTNVEVTEEEVNEEIDRARKQNARTITVEGRPAADGDKTVIDFEGFVDGKAFEGGKGTDYPLTLGSHSFIDGFEDQIVGKNVGDSFDVNVTFPKNYQAKELAGKPAVFKVTLKELKAEELPEADDEFAQDVSDFDTFKEYKEDIKKNILVRKENEAKRVKEDAVIASIIESSKMDIPEAMLNTQVRQMAEEFAERIQQQGLSVDQYFKFTGMNSQTFLDNLRPEAEKRIQSRLVLEAIVKAEKIEVSDKELEEELDKMAKTYNMEVAKIKEMLGDEQLEAIKKDIAVSKAADFVTENAKEGKAAAKKSTAKKTTAKAEKAEEEAPAEEKPKKAAAKKTTTAKKTTAKAEDAAAEEKPKKTTTRKSTKKAEE